MKPRCLLRLAFVCALLTPFLSSNAAQPNIVIFYADDLGWGELGCQGYTKDIPTPHIDALAKNGLRFTNGYVAATYCSPSRAGLMTGRYPTRFGHEFNTVANTVGLRSDQTTIATRLVPSSSTRVRTCNGSCTRIPVTSAVKLPGSTVPSSGVMSERSAPARSTGSPAGTGRARNTETAKSANVVRQKIRGRHVRETRAKAERRAIEKLGLAAG